MSDLDFPWHDLVSVLRSRARKHPQRIAFEFLGDGDTVTERLSYGDYDRRACALAALLRQQAAAGDRAMLLFHTGPDYAVAFFACLYAGLIAVPAYPPEGNQPQALQRLRGMMADARPALALTDDAGLQALSLHGLAQPGMRIVSTTAAAPNAPTGWQPHAPQPDDVAFLQYTSGSTALPKGVMVTHRNLVADKLSISHTADESAEDRFMSWLPLFHDLGLIFGLLQPLFCGLPLVMMSPRHFLERPRRWLEAISRHRATISGGPDFAYRLCADRIRPEVMAGLDLSCWRVAFSGAEPIRHTTMTAFAAAAAPAGFSPEALNAWYGLAEATLVVTGNRRGSGMHWQRFDTAMLAQGQAAPGAGGSVAAVGTVLPACGHTAPGIAVRIADPASGRPLPEAAVGEIWVQGATVAAGYWCNTAATQATFAAAGAAGDGPFLRTGDLGFLHEGRLYLSGRLKDLIILRGRNVYPQDIELEVESRAQGVRPGRVVAFAVEHRGAEAIGIAAEAARLRPGQGDADGVIDAVRAAVAAAIGEPVAAVALLKAGTLPRTSSGKLQRAACRQGWLDGSLETVAVYRADESTAEFMAPETPTQQGLARLWSELLERDPSAIGALDTFVGLGGQSLLVTQLALRVQAQFGVGLPLSVYFAPCTLAELAQHIDTAARVPQRPAPVPLERHAGDLLPLSFAQQRLWFLQTLEPDSDYYHVATQLEFSAPPDPLRLQHALDHMMATHEALRTTIVETDQGPRQRVGPAAPLQMRRLQVADDLASHAEVRRFVSEPFDLARGPLLRALWLQVGPPQAGDGHVRVVLAFHHIAVDGWSLKLLLDHLATAYAGEAPAAPRLQYADHAAWQQQELAVHLPALAEAWRMRLQGVPALSTLPPDFERPPRQSHRGASLRLELPHTLVNALREWASSRQATLFMGLFAGFAATLAEAAGQDDVVIGTDVANRHTIGSEGVVGFLVNQLPVRCRCRPGRGGGEWLAMARDTLRAAYALQDLPFDHLVQALRPVRDLSHAPVFQTKFVFQDAPKAHVLAPGLRMTSQAPDRHTAELDLLFDLALHRQGVSVRVEYATDLYRSDTVARFAARFVACLESWAAPAAEPTAGRRPRPIGRRAAAPTTEDHS